MYETVGENKFEKVILFQEHNKSQIAIKNCYVVKQISIY